MRFLLSLVLVFCLQLQGAFAQAPSRVALIIGNANYSHAPRLVNPESDANSIGEALRRMGFSVMEQRNLGVDDMRKALRSFAKEAAAADVALVYYAGHGIEVSGSNYLIPTDASLKSELDIDYELVPVDLVMRSIAGAKSLRIVLLDACRDNPFAPQMASGGGRQRSVGRGLGRVDTSMSNTVVAYAAAAGATAADGDRQSPFAEALLKHIETPGLEVRLFLGRVRDTVLDLTRQRQEPFVYSSLGGREFYLGPSGTAATSSQVDPAELLFWQSVKDSTSEPVLQTYLQRYPSGTFAALARARIADLGRHASLPPSIVSPPPAELKAPPPPGGSPIVIGVAGPMSGVNAAFGAQLKRGVEQAVEDLNAAGGIGGRKLVVQVGDDASDPRQGVAVANRFVGDGVKLVVGHFNSGVTLPASDVYAANGVLVVTPASSNPRLTERGLWNIFRTCGRDDQQGRLWASYAVNNLKGKTIAIVHDKTAYGLGLAEGARAALAAAGVREVLFEGVDFGQKDYSPVVGKIKASGATVVMWGGLHTEAGLIIRQLRGQGVNVTMISGDGITSDEFAAIGGDAVIGTLMSFPRDPRKNPAAAPFLARFRAKGVDPDGYTLYAYAAVQVIKQAAEQAGTVDTRKMAEIMRSGAGFRTALGDLAFDRKGDRTSLDYVMYSWKRTAGGKIGYVEN